MGFTTAARLLILSCAALAGSAAAQVNLAPLRLPALPATDLAGPLGPSVHGATQLGPDSLASLHRTRLQELIRRNRQMIEADPNGEPMLRGQLLGLDLSPAALEHLATAGFTRVGEQRLEGVDISLDVLRAPPGLSTRRALQELRALEPGAVFDYDHIYAGSGADMAADAPVTQTSPQPPASPGAGTPPAAEHGHIARVGLIDSGVQVTHVAFHGVPIALWGCGGRSVPSTHGTAVASLLIGDDAPFRGAAPGAQLYAADVYCDQPTGGTVDAIAGALGWLDANRIAVVNVSLVGPDNRVLRQVVTQMIARGHIIVAAVGNDGPAAPPLYPAAYPEVVGVTAVDAHRHALLEAGRGAQVEFAAPGADMAAAHFPDGYALVRGTSFAAPLVAGLLALRLPLPDHDAARAAIDSLAHEAIHMGASGRDATYGLGLVAEGLRVAPDIIQPPATPRR
jgi:hypothetical protein